MKKILAVALIVVAGVFMLSVPSVMAQGETGDCFGNFDCDQDVDAVDVANFVSSFGRSPLFNPCPLCQDSLCPCSSTVPKTGLTGCWDETGQEIDCTGTGQDGDLQKGLDWPNPRFTDNGDGTVRDNLTNLIWLKDANCFNPRTWNQALSDCNGLADGSCGLTDGSNAGDWRLPNRFELESLLDMSNYGSALPSGHPFSYVGGYYWSSTTTVATGMVYNYAWVMLIYSGSLHYGLKTDLYVVWPVRDPL
jgi:hypothetical protein